MDDKLKENVKKMVASGVPEDEIAAFIKKFSTSEKSENLKRAEETAETGSMLKNMLSNYPQSFGNLVKGAAQGLWQTVRHPSQTLDKLMIGATENVLGPALGAAQKRTGIGSGAIPAYEAAKNKLLNSKYTSPTKFAKYLEEDPAQAQADIALALTGGGKLAKELGAIKTGEGIMKAGAMAEPLTAPLKVTGTIAGKMMPSRFAQKMYSSSAKMSTIMDPEVRQRISQKLLDAEVKLNTKGFKKLADDFESMWKGVDGLIDEYVTTGTNQKRTVVDLLKGIDQWEERANLTGRSSVVKNIKKQFIRDLTETVNLGGKPVRIVKELDAKQINRVKRDIYQELHSQYGKEMVPMKSAVKMSIAHNAMEMLEEMIPGIIPKNKTAAAYKELMDAIQKGVNRIENRDLFSIGMPVRAGGTAVLSEALGVDTKVGGVAGLALGLLDIPSVKSRVAIRLNKLKTQGVKLSPTSTALKIGIIKIGKDGKFYGGDEDIPDKNYTIKTLQVENANNIDLSQFLRKD